MAHHSETKSHSNIVKHIFMVLGIMVVFSLFGKILFDVYQDIKEKGHEKERMEQEAKAVKQKEKIEKQKKEKQDLHMLNLVKEETLKRTFAEIYKYEELSSDVEFEDDTKENYLIREWEEDTKEPTFFPYYLKIINQKQVMVVDRVRLTVKFEKTSKKIMYSYYEYKGKVYNPTIHLPYPGKK